MPTGPFQVLFFRWKVNLALTFTCLCSYQLASGSIGIPGLAVVGGLFLFASGAALLNHLQELAVDACMPRTQLRPLISRIVSIPSFLVHAYISLFLGIGMIAMGSWLGTGNTMAAIALSLFSLFMYNLVYTPLKKASLWAPFPGAINGASPVLIGWAAGGGALMDTRIWVLFLFMFIWQIPHFFLLLFRFGSEYENAGLKVISSQLSKERLVRITYIWIITTGIAALMFPLAGLIPFNMFSLVLVCFTLFILYEFKKILNPSWKDLYTPRAFVKINLFGLTVISCVLLSNLLL
jgi:protoheme IX farnesyltransferase